MMVYESLSLAIHDGWMLDAITANGYLIRRSTPSGWENGVVDFTIQLSGKADEAN